MNNRKDISSSKAAAAGMAHATMGRNRVFGSAGRPECDDSAEQIADALEDLEEEFDANGELIDAEYIAMRQASMVHAMGSYIPNLPARFADEELMGV